MGDNKMLKNAEYVVLHEIAWSLPKELIVMRFMI